MDDPRFLTRLHIELAQIFFELEASVGYLVAGEAGLLASDLIARPTQDVDLFASTPISSVTEAKTELMQELGRRGYDVTVVQDGATFCRMVLRHDASELLVDLAIDSPPIGTTAMTLLGPTLSP